MMVGKELHSLSKSSNHGVKRARIADEDDEEELIITIDERKKEKAIIRNQPILFTSSFRTLRDRRGRFVDKTLFLKRIHTADILNVIIRPHNFGKSLIADMTGCFYGLEVDELGNKMPRDQRTNPSFFRNTLIWDYEEDEMNSMGKYPLIHLRFDKIHEDNIEDGIKNVMIEAYRGYRHLRLPDVEKNMDESLANLILLLFEKYVKSVVVIIDDFDIPFNCLLSRFQKAVSEKEKDTLKQCARTYYHLLAGVVRYQEFVEFAVFFGSLLLDYSPLLVKDYSKLFVAHSSLVAPQKFAEDFGFTSTEIVKYYPEVVEKNQNPNKNRMYELRKWYGNYKSADIEVFAPFSVMSYVKNDFLLTDYLSESSGISLIPDFINIDSILAELQKLINFGEIRSTVAHKPSVITGNNELLSIQDIVGVFAQVGLINSHKKIKCLHDINLFVVTNEECHIILYKKLRETSTMRKFVASPYRESLVDSILNHKWIEVQILLESYLIDLQEPHKKNKMYYCGIMGTILDEIVHHRPNSSYIYGGDDAEEEGLRKFDNVLVSIDLDVKEGIVFKYAVADTIDAFEKTSKEMRSQVDLDLCFNYFGLHKHITSVRIVIVVFSRTGNECYLTTDQIIFDVEPPIPNARKT